MARPLGAYCVVEFLEGPQFISSNWLDEAQEYCYWPPWASTIDQTRYDRMVKKRPIPEDDWSQEEILKIRADGDDYERVRAKLRRAESESDTDLNQGIVTYPSGMDSYIL